LKSLSVIARKSRATIKWYSSSVLELSAYPRNLAKSRSLFWHLPSTMFAGIDIDARIICDRIAAYLELRMPVATLWTLSVNACAFRQT